VHSVILFCVATATDYGAVGITAHALQSMAIRGFIAHNRESGALRSRIVVVPRSTPSLSMAGLEGNKNGVERSLAGLRKLIRELISKAPYWGGGETDERRKCRLDK